MIKVSTSVNSLMSLTNLLLLQILGKKRKSISLSEVVRGFRELGMTKPPTKTSIYANLQKLAAKEQVEITWENANKLYKLSATGIDELVKIETLLMLNQNERTA
jgi:Transcriptional regulator PadR-like family.